MYKIVFTAGEIPIILNILAGYGQQLEVIAQTPAQQSEAAIVQEVFSRMMTDVTLQNNISRCAGGIFTVH